MATLNNFIFLIRGKLDGCPEFIMEDAVRDSAIEFCRKTRLFIENSTVRVRPGLSAYELFPPEGEAWEVVDLRRDGVSLNPGNRSDFIVEGFDRNAGQPSSFYMEGDGRLMLGPIPETEEALSITVTSSPSMSATIVNDALLRDWREAIAAGAEYLIRDRTSEFDDPQKKMEAKARFREGVTEALIKITKGGNVNKRTRTVGQYL